jgi:hypothetical protein
LTFFLKKDSNLILWDLEAPNEPLQKIDVTSLIDTTKSDDKGIDKFYFNSNNNQLFVHLFGRESLLYFNYDNNKFNFQNEIKIDDEIVQFECLYDNYFLFYLFDKETTAKQSIKIKKFEKKEVIYKIKFASFQLYFFNLLFSFKFKQLDCEKNKNEKFLSLIMVNLNETIDFTKDWRDEYRNDYKGFFKMRVDGAKDYYERKQQRINNTSSKGVQKRKLSTSDDDNEAKAINATE